MTLFADYQPMLMAYARHASWYARQPPRTSRSSLPSTRLGKGSQPSSSAASFQREFDAVARGLVQKHLCVAEVAGEVVGYGRATYLPIHEIAGAWGMPPGWYLGGIIVDASHRRRGVGHAITEHRIAWIATAADAVYYRVNALKGAALRAALCPAARTVDKICTCPTAIV